MTNRLLIAIIFELWVLNAIAFWGLVTWQNDRRNDKADRLRKDARDKEADEEGFDIGP